MSDKKIKVKKITACKMKMDWVIRLNDNKNKINFFLCTWNVYVCVCVWEREREREYVYACVVGWQRKTEKDRERQRVTELYVPVITNNSFLN